MRSIRWGPALLGMVLMLLVGIFASDLIRPDIPDAPEYSDVIVEPAQLAVGEPDTVVKFIERIRNPVVEPRQVARAPQAGVPDVSAFCSAAGWTPDEPIPVRPNLAGADNDAPPERTSDLATPARDPRLLVSSWSHDGRTLKVWGPLSTGDKAQLTYDVRTPYTATVHGERMLVQRERLSLPPPLRDALWFAGGAAAGYTLASVF